MSRRVLAPFAPLVIQHDFASLQSAGNIAAENPTYPIVAQVTTELTTLVRGVTHFAQTIAASC